MKLGKRQKAWVEALRGDYRQCNGALCEVQNKHSKYCCLGVLLHINGVKKTKPQNYFEVDYGYRHFVYGNNEFDSVLPQDFADDLGLNSDSGSVMLGKLSSKRQSQFIDDTSKYGGDVEQQSLVNLNDNGASFKVIADLLETYPEAFFTKSV